MKKFIFVLEALALGSVSFAIEDAFVSWELVDSDDIRIQQISVQASEVISGWDTTASIARTEYDVDYEPVDFDFLGEPAERSESNVSLQLNTRKALGENFWILGSLGVYDGFTSYSSIWLDQYFAERFSDLPEGVEGADNYIAADPKGINGSVGIRWQYKPNTGYAQLTLSQLRDDISPGYEIDFDGLTRSSLVLATSAISLSTENILTKRIRTLVELRGSRTSERDWRYGLQASGNFGLSDKLIAKLQVGAAIENPDFEAYYGNLELSYSITDTISIYADARYYEDTGEIEDSLLFTSAAPGVETNKQGIGIRWMTGEKWSARIYFSRLSSTYEPTNPNTDFFQNLYRDRDWDIAQISFGKTF
ncbi:hypothetical protein MLD52_03015 [Puniceicoccaceae bacterium K14]|nr:hypothetical protein [Puniceicoccaceae bacterium K14]